jgi:para-aminobenzoate synthetase/4-amino-4-deoxychorismate lyase
VAHSVDEVADVLEASDAARRCGHWVAGFVGYEAAPGLDPSLPGLCWPRGHPLASLPLVCFTAFERHTRVGSPRRLPSMSNAIDWRLTQDRCWHADAVAAARDEISAGEYYQLNLTARLAARVRDPARLYSELAAAQSGDCNALIITDRHVIASASPELFFERRGDRITTRPMKGTASRGRSSQEDRDQVRALLGSAKERAENTMIVDLLRNDLGRISVTGSVVVPRLFDVETYPTVHQLTSTVQARLRPGIQFVDVLRSLFPCGSVTGAPKRAAMLGIAKLEAQPRGVYCGAVGWLAPGSPSADRFSVAIRTVTQDRATGYAEYGAGGGITWSSNAQAEWDELIAKTAILGSVASSGAGVLRGA